MMNAGSPHLILSCLGRVASSCVTARHYAHQNHLVALAMYEWHNSFARLAMAYKDIGSII